MNKSKQQFHSAFTIVELLIVIVVIGILAAITIVAYNGVQDRARAATAQSDASNAAQQLEVTNTTDDAYPLSADDLDKSDGTTFQYSYDSSANSYCLTTTNGLSSYKVSSDNPTPQPGGCPGHGVGGVAAITNLIADPSVEDGALGASGTYYNPSVSIDNTTAVSGGKSVKVVTVGAAYPQGFIWRATVNSPGTYTCSVSIKGTPGVVVDVGGRTEATGGAYLGEGQNSKQVTLSSNWQRVSVTYSVSQANIGYVAIQYHLDVAADGITIWGDAAMCTSGTTLYGYADGNSPSWIWNGTPNNSSSTGPGL